MPTRSLFFIAPLVSSSCGWLVGHALGVNHGRYIFQATSGGTPPYLGDKAFILSGLQGAYVCKIFQTNDLELKYPESIS